MRAEIISVGTELLLGEIIDTNAAYLSQRLARLGVDVLYRVTVGDNLGRLADQIRQSMQRAEIVILCGGLGPTEDDLTREAVAEATGKRLIRLPEIEQWLREFFTTRGRQITPNNLRQAQVPEGGRTLPNEVGTAPGVVVEAEGRLIVALPGPPTELRPMWEHHAEAVVRDFAARSEAGRSLYTRILRLVDIGESQVANELEDVITAQTDPTIALYASPGEVKVRMATKAASPEEAAQRFGPVEAQVRQRLGSYIYAVDDETMEQVVGRLLRERGATLAVAESCTGGLIGHRITNVPGASEYFLAGYVTYSNDAKMDVLGVPEHIIRTHGAVSEECARAMAQGARRRAGATHGLATTGIAGPTGGTPTKPVGTVFIAVADESRCVVDGFCWPTERTVFKERVAQMALSRLRKFILGEI
ncbi:MAG: competence/damage-inducible protein A [Armatimonadetes bacterium]|nr:competence/damage-inducible protein A [Armatimonadota bacterium]